MFTPFRANGFTPCPRTTSKIFYFIYFVYTALNISYSKCMRTFQCFIDPLFSSQITYKLHQPNWKLICTLSIYLSMSLGDVTKRSTEAAVAAHSRSSTHKTILSCLVFSLNMWINICCVRGFSPSVFSFYAFCSSRKKVLVEYKHFSPPPLCVFQRKCKYAYHIFGYVRKFC